MKALAIDRRPGVGELSSCLRMMELPVPTPGRREVRIKIAGTAINVDDQHLAEGTMFGGFPIAPKPTKEKPWVPGTDLVGTIDSLGAGVSGVQIGQRVYGMRPPRLAGPWAEFGITKATFVAPVPEHWSTEEAAALCLGGLVVIAILKALGDPTGKRCVVVAASGSIGTLLVATLHHAGARVWGVCSARNRELIEGLGAERVLDYDDGPFGDQIRALGGRADAVLDLLGGTLTEVQGHLATAGRGAFITIVGPEQHVGERRLSAWRLARMVGHIGRKWLGSRITGPRYSFVGPLAPDFSEIDRWIIAKGIRPTIDSVVSFGEEPVRKALRYVASHRARGKVVITM